MQYAYKCNAIKWNKCNMYMQQMQCNKTELMQYVYKCNAINTMQ